MSAPSAEPRLLDRVRQAVLARHYSPKTAKAYAGWVRRFVLFHDKRHPRELGEKEIADYLTYLATDRQVSASTQNQALSAILFLYRHVEPRDLGNLEGIVRAKRPKRLPVVLTRDEIRKILGVLKENKWLMCALMYGTGMRLQECVTLRVKDVDFGAGRIVIRGGKGAKDRRALLPVRVREPLRAHLERVRAQHREDLDRDAGWVEVPGAIGRKFPNAGREWSWQWVFPATRCYRHPETGQWRRHHFHETALQRSFKDAVAQVKIPKPATCHTLRH